MATNTTKQTTPEENLQTSTLFGGASSDLLKSVQEKLLGQAGAVSSTTSELESRLTAAISGIGTAQEATAKRIESQFGRELGFQKDIAGQAVVAGRAAGSGGLLNISALRELTQTTDKSLKDLEQRKQELLLANDAAGASKIAELEFRALEFKQVAQQNIFSNLLGISNLGIQTAQEARLGRQQTFQEQQATAGIALQYGLTIQPGETLADVVTRAMPIASEEQKAGLANIIADTKLKNAQAAKALQGDANGVTDLSLPTLVNQTILFDAEGRSPTADAEYSNLLGTITKAGKLTDYYRIKQQMLLAQVEAEKQAVTEAQKPRDGFSGTEFNPKTNRIEKFTVDPITNKKTFTSIPTKIDFSNVDFTKIDKDLLKALSTPGLGQ